MPSSGVLANYQGLNLVGYHSNDSGKTIAARLYPCGNGDVGMGG